MSAPTEDVNMGNTAQEGGQDSATPASTAVAAEQQPATSGDGQAATETDGQPETAANCEVGKKRKVADVDDSADAKEGVSGDISQADAKEAAGKTHDGSGSSDSDSDKGSDSDSDSDYSVYCGEPPEVGTICTVRLKIGENVSRVHYQITSNLRRSRFRKKHFPGRTFPY
mmetsp:Transcript_6788/g.9921  ORF Transcript_6788/g.9921 Transcript_6788/m.9921 type:complete len:170 (+) Transcript_6788:226-735(+)